MNLAYEVKKYFKEGSIEKAILATNEFMSRLNPSTRRELGEIFTGEAQRLIQEKKYKEAFRLIEQSYKIDRFNNTTNSLLASVYYTKAKHCEDVFEAKKLLKKALNFNPKLESARTLLGKLNDKHHQKEKEKNMLKANIKRNDSLLSKLRLCNINLKEKKINEITNILKTIEYDENNKEIVLLFSKVDIIQGNIEEAIDKLSNLRKKLYDSRIEVLLGRIYTRLENYDEAFDLIYNAYKKNSNDTFTIMEIIKYYIVTKQYKEALYVFDNKLDKLMAVDSLKKTYIPNTQYYLKKMLGYDEQSQNYIQRQIDKYQETICLKELYGYESSTHSVSVKPIFKCSVLDIFDYSKEKIQNMLPVDKDLLDTYIVKSESLEGKVNTIITNTFEVKTISNTKNIVEILPICNEYAESTIIKNDVKKMGELK